LLLVLFLHRSAVIHIGVCAVVQGIVGFPFLMQYPIEYVSQSFNLARTFKRYWSVNFKWVPCEALPSGQETLLRDCEGLFTSKIFGIGLLTATACCWVLFACKCGAGGQETGEKREEAFLWTAIRGNKPFTNTQIVTVMLLSNFIGVAFSRSLHFQFYVWYFHSLPFLLWCTRFPDIVKILMFVLVEMCWNPWEGETSTISSSMLLTGLHVLLLVGLFEGLRVAHPKEGAPALKED